MERVDTEYEDAKEGSEGVSGYCANAQSSRLALRPREIRTFAEHFARRKIPKSKQISAAQKKRFLGGGAGVQFPTKTSHVSMAADISPLVENACY